MKHILYITFIFSCYLCSAQSLDLKLLRAINKNEYPKWDQTMRITSKTVFPMMCAAPIAIGFTGFINNDKVMMRNGVKTGIAIGLNALLTSGIKYTFNRPRPSIQYPDDVVRRTESGKYSFPSGHTSNAFAMATALTLSTKKWYVAVPSYLYWNRDLPIGLAGR